MFKLAEGRRNPLIRKIVTGELLEALHYFVFDHTEDEHYEEYIQDFFIDRSEFLSDFSEKKNRGYQRKNIHC